MQIVNRKKCVLLSVLLVGLLCLSHAVFAVDVVKGFDAEGTLELEDGARVRLAGIHVDESGRRLLGVLLAGKEVDLKWDKDAPPGMKRAFVYVKTQELPLPFGPERTDEKTIMVNEYLLSMGSATVDGTYEHRYEERFLELQDEARTRGEGIWSYE